MKTKIKYQNKKYILRKNRDKLLQKQIDRFINCKEVLWS